MPKSSDRNWVGWGKAGNESYSPSLSQMWREHELVGLVTMSGSPHGGVRRVSPAAHPCVWREESISSTSYHAVDMGTWSVLYWGDSMAILPHCLGHHSVSRCSWGWLNGSLLKVCVKIFLMSFFRRAKKEKRKRGWNEDHFVVFITV